MSLFVYLCPECQQQLGIGVCKGLSLQVSGGLCGHIHNVCVCSSDEDCLKASLDVFQSFPLCICFLKRLLSMWTSLHAYDSEAHMALIFDLENPIKSFNYQWPYML